MVSVTVFNATQRDNKLTLPTLSKDRPSAEEMKGKFTLYLRYHTVTPSGIAPIGWTTKNHVRVYIPISNNTIAIVMYNGFFFIVFYK